MVKIATSGMVPGVFSDNIQERTHLHNDIPLVAYT